MSSQGESRPDALILAGLGYKGYGLVRSLGRESVLVVGVTHHPKQAALAATRKTTRLL